MPLCWRSHSGGHGRHPERASRLTRTRPARPEVPPRQTTATISNGASEPQSSRHAAWLKPARCCRQPGAQEATEIWEAARAAIAELEGSLAEAERRVAAGDAEGASKALDRARAIDPTAPRLAELSTQLLRLRSQTRVAATQPTPGRSASPASSATPVGAKPATGTVAEPASPGAPERTSPVTSVAPQVRRRSPDARSSDASTRPRLPSAGRIAARASSQREPPSPPTPAPHRGLRGSRADDAPVPAAPAPEDVPRFGQSWRPTRAIVTKDLALTVGQAQPVGRRRTQARRRLPRRVFTAGRHTVLSIERRGSAPRCDCVGGHHSGRGGPQTTESQQSMALARTSGSWVILDIR
jgi:hypothetical protein